jgi:hypothetical protein
LGKNRMCILLSKEWGEKTLLTCYNVVIITYRFLLLDITTSPISFLELLVFISIR